MAIRLSAGGFTKLAARSSAVRQQGTERIAHAKAMQTLIGSFIFVQILNIPSQLLQMEYILAGCGQGAFIEQLYVWWNRDNSALDCCDRAARARYKVLAEFSRD